MLELVGLHSGNAALTVIRKAGKKREAPWLDPDWRSWYQLERWRRIRRAQLCREPLCRFCLLSGIATPATVADHVESHRGDWTAFITGKLCSLCAHCHDSQKKLNDNAQVLDEDGWPLGFGKPPPMRFPG